MRIAIFLSAACLLFAGAAHAQSQGAMIAQADAAYRAADARLNEVYRTLLGTLSPQSRTHLVQAQRAWIAFRDSECRLKTSGAEGGSIYATAVSQCLERATRERTRQLQAMLDCPEGDAACPG